MMPTRFVPLMLLLLFTVGCGQGSYEKLMKSQVGALGTWRPFVADTLGFKVKLPEGAGRTVTPEDLDGATEVTVEQPWQSSFFRVKASQSNNIDLQAEAKSTEDFYVSQGYTLDNQAGTSVGRLSAVDLRFSQEEGDAMAIRIVQTTQSVVTLTMTGATINESVKSQFFDSVEALSRVRRR